MSDPALFEMPDHAYAYRLCPVCGCALSVRYTHTYVVQRQVWVKIGATNRPRQRFNELARYDWRKYVLSPARMDWHQPLHRVALFETDVEHDSHRALAEYHAVGEWFWDGPAVRRWIASLA